MIVEIEKAKFSPNKFTTMIKSIGNSKATPVRTADETRHSIASALEGKLKNHPAQCIPPKTPPTKGSIFGIFCGIKSRYFHIANAYLRLLGYQHGIPPNTQDYTRDGKNQGEKDRKSES